MQLKTHLTTIPSNQKMDKLSLVRYLKDSFSLIVAVLWLNVQFDTKYMEWNSYVTESTRNQPHP